MYIFSPKPFIDALFHRMNGEFLWRLAALTCTCTGSVCLFIYSYSFWTQLFFCFPHAADAEFMIINDYIVWLLITIIIIISMSSYTLPFLSNLECISSRSGKNNLVLLLPLPLIFHWWCAAYSLRQRHAVCEYVYRRDVYRNQTK